MFRILIADDEGIMRESIKNTIQANFGSECEIITAKTGREVVEQCETFRPDIAFVDIQMPGLSGIQAVQEVQKTRSGIVFIIITAYDRFSYAQEAVNLGIMEYVMKPVGKQKILDVCVRAMRMVETARNQRSADLKIREKLEIVIPMIETAFINNLLQDEDSHKNRDYLEMLDIQSEFGYLTILEFGDSLEDGVLSNALGSNVRANKSYPELQEIIRDFQDSIIGPVMGNRIILYTPYPRSKTNYEDRVEIITRTRNMIHRLESTLDLKFRAGIGEVESIDNAYISYKEALQCLRRSDRHVVHFIDLSAASDESADYPHELENRYIQLGLKGDSAAILPLIEEFCQCLESAGQITIGEARMKGLELLLRLERKSQEAGILSQEFRQHEGYLSDISGIHDYAGLRKWLSDRSREVCEEIGSGRQKDSESVVERARLFIREHFAEDISLDDVARHVDISPYYFSRLFKQEMGENFVEYLTSIRMDKAREYLANPKYSIKEVCGMCGYSDPNYFSRIFRKYEGVSPTEYRS